MKKEKIDPNQKWSGERLETFIFSKNTIEHLHRYALAVAISKGLDVLDIASGEGYGSNLISRVANKVTGVDISGETIKAAAKKYKKNNLTFKEGSASEIPLDTNSVDVVVSFETIEHHDLHQQMMTEIKRVLKPDGVLLMSSPDKKYYSDVPKYVNPFHVKELYFEEFKSLIKSYFANAEFFFQKIVSGSLIVHENLPAGFKEYVGDYQNLKEKEYFAPVYNLCIASDRELSYLPSNFFDGDNIIKKALELAVHNKEQEYKNTWSYRIGHFLLYPFKMFRKSK